MAPGGTVVRLRDELHVLWRSPGESQIGLDPRCGVVLTGLTEGEQRLLDVIRTGLTTADVVHAGRALGVPAARSRRLVRLLERAGVLCSDAPPSGPPLPDPQLTAAGRAADVAYWGRLRPDADGWAVLAGRRQTTMAVLGVDRIGLLIAAGLAAAGCGTVLLADTEPVRALDVGPGSFGWADVGRSRDEAGADRLRTLTPDVRTTAPSGTTPDLAVLVEHGVASPVRARPLIREDIAHLSVVVGEVDVLVGPLVVPGQGPCLRCLDLHRCDSDDRWPAVATQVAAAPPHGVESSLAPLAAALAVGQLLAHIDGRTAQARGAVLEVSALSAVPVLRRWPVHPQCGCTELAGGATPERA